MIINYNCRHDVSDTKQLRHSGGLIRESLRHNYFLFPRMLQSHKINTNAKNVSKIYPVFVFKSNAV